MAAPVILGSALLSAMSARLAVLFVTAAPPTVVSWLVRHSALAGARCAVRYHEDRRFLAGWEVGAGGRAVIVELTLVYSTIVQCVGIENKLPQRALARVIGIGNYVEAETEIYVDVILVTISIRQICIYLRHNSNSSSTGTNIRLIRILTTYKCKIISSGIWSIAK